MKRPERKYGFQLLAEIYTLSSQFYMYNEVSAKEYIIPTQNDFIDVTYEVVEEPKEVKLITDGLDT